MECRKENKLMTMNEMENSIRRKFVSSRSTQSEEGIGQISKSFFVFMFVAFVMVISSYHHLTIYMYMKRSLILLRWDDQIQFDLL